MDRFRKLTTLFLLLSYPLTNAIFFTPSLPKIVLQFGLSSTQSDLTMTAYLIGYAFGQLPYGPLANRFGRKKALYTGLCISILGCFLCILASKLVSFPLLVGARFLQALGASVGLKISFTMIADSHTEKEGTKMISLLGTGFSIVPAIGIMTGGYLTQSFSWESCFYFLAFYGVFILWLSSNLEETSKKLDVGALKPREILSGYFSVCKNKPLVLSGLIIGLGTAISYIFNAKAPFVGIVFLQLSPEVFGMCSLIPLFGMFIGSVLSHRLAGTKYMIHWFVAGSVISLGASVFMFFQFSRNMGSVVALFFPTFLIYMIDSIIFSNISSFGLAREENKANGSAILHFISLSTAAVFMFGIKLIQLSHELLIPTCFISIVLMILAACVFLKPLTSSFPLILEKRDFDV